MPPDFEKYRHYVDDYDLTEAQKESLIHIVHRMMENAVDRAFGDDSVQLALVDAFAKSAPSFTSMIELNKDEYQSSKTSQSPKDKKGNNVR